MSASLINTSNITGNFVEMTSGLNEASGGLLVTVILFVLYIILFTVSRNQGVKVALLGISFIMSILATLAWQMDWIAGYVVMFPIVALIIGAFIIRLTDD